MLIGGNVLTARHCLQTSVEDYLGKGHDVYVVSARGARLIPRQAAKDLYGAPFSSQSSSFPNDFVVFSETTLSTPASTPGVTALLAKPATNQSVVVDGGDGRRASCTIKNICGSRLFYTCHPATDEGWSGSPVLTDDVNPQLVGVHTAAPVSTPKGEKLSEGTSLQTVLGRSSALFGTSEEFSAEIARSRKYAYSWSKGCDALAPAVRMGSPLETRLVPRAALFTAMVFWNDGTLLAANIDRSRPELCQLSGSDGWKAWQCVKNRTPLADRINKLSRLPDGELAIGEALLPPSMRKAGDSADFVAGGVTFGRIALSDGGPVLSIERRVSTPFGSVYALQPFEDGVIVGGENGICIIVSGARTCTPICRRTLCTKDDEWRVNGLLRLDNRTVLAVGRDMTEGRVYPMAKWYRRDDGGWRQLAALGPRAALVSLSSSLLSRRTGMQLKAPVLVHGEAVAFGSDGSAYRLATGQEPQRLSISRMWKVSSPDANRDEIEDAVRDAVVLRSGYIAVAASDGAVHLLKPGARAPLALEGDQGLTVFDRGIWTTELAQAKDTLFVRAQDGNIHFIDLAKLQRSSAVTSR